MNHGPIIFLGVLASFVASWWGLVFAPQLQVGSQQPAQVETGIYPARRPGLAEQGRGVYVANGCVHCHSQQVQQEGYTFDVVLTSGGTNAPDAVAKVIEQVAPGVNAKDVLSKASEQSPQPILQNVPQKVAASTLKTLSATGAVAQVVFIPLGPDIARRWGTRRTVGADYLYEYPVQIGNSRLGPDLANIGARVPAVEWHLQHLYDPRTTVPGSIMPANRYLFETRKIGKHASTNALALSGKLAPKEGYEVVPTPEALQLVAYLQSLRVDTALFEAPLTQLAPPPAEAGTNAPASTNAPAAQNAAELLKVPADAPPK
jgi:cbb3-type cytochrome oxidase cytochrome c subunit